MFGLSKIFGDRRSSVCAPMTGILHPIEEAPDEVFAGKMMGDGFFIEPSLPLVVAPGNGEVVMIADAAHAIGMKLSIGAEILLHMGIDTVELDGRGFEVLVQTGQKVKAGDPLMRVDLPYIRKHAKSDVCLVVFTGGEQVTLTNKGEVEAGTQIASLQYTI